MKKILCIIISVSLLLIIFSCGSETPQKVTGVVKKFEPRVQVGGSYLPRIEFTDGRFFFFDAMPRSQVDAGSEIKIYYSRIYAGPMICVDSVATIKTAPKQIAPVDTTKIH